MRRAAALASLYVAALAGATPAPAASPAPDARPAQAAAEMSRLTVHPAPKPPATTPFVDAEGRAHRLTDWRGKVVLVNFWATWCPPCLKEMPSIDRLAAAMEGPDFEVLAISTDRGDVSKPARWFAANGIARLEVLHDPKAALAREVGLLGQPTTLILDREGREIARYLGEAEWDSPEAKALIEGILRQTAARG